MTTPPNRQPEGIPAGGQFASGAHAEPDVSIARPAVPPKIIATVHLQKWVNDEAEQVGEITFDASRILAAMTPEKRADIEDDDYSADDVFHAAVAQGLAAEHDGPFSVYVQEAMVEAERLDTEVFDKLAALPENRPAEAILHEPLSAYEIGARADEDGFVSGLATMSFSDLIDNDLEAHCDKVGEDLVGSPLLMQPVATPVRVQPDGTMVVKLEGDASAIIDDFSDDEKAQYEAGRAERHRR